MRVGNSDVGFDESENRLTDILAGDGVVQDRGAVGGCDGGDDARWVGGANRFRGFAGGDGEGELIDAGAVVVVGEFEEDKNGVETGKFCRVVNRYGLDGAGFCAEPALVRQVGGEQLLKQSQARAGEKAIDALAEQVEDWFVFGDLHRDLGDLAAGWSSSQRKEYGASVSG